jgi:hypothetical protein
MTGRDLDRLLSRWNFGGIAPEVLALEMRELVQRLRDDSIDVRDSSTVRLWDEALITDYDNAMHQASSAIDARQWRTALRQIHECERVIAAMRALVQASDAIERATAAMERVHELAGTALLRRLPAPASLAQIVDEAKQCVGTRHSPQASHIAAIAERMANALCERRLVTAGEHAAAHERIAAIRELCIATRSYADPADDEPTRDGSLSTLQSLLADRYAVLATRLLSELEIFLAGRRRFLLHLQRRQLGGTAMLGDVDAVRTLVRERSWDGAVDHYWHASIASHAGLLKEHQRRTAAIDAEIQSAMTPLQAARVWPRGCRAY